MHLLPGLVAYIMPRVEYENDNVLSTSRQLISTQTEKRSSLMVRSGWSCLSVILFYFDTINWSRDSTRSARCLNHQLNTFFIERNLSWWRKSCETSIFLLQWVNTNFFSYSSSNWSHFFFFIETNVKQNWLHVHWIMKNKLINTKQLTIARKEFEWHLNSYLLVEQREENFDLDLCITFQYDFWFLKKCQLFGETMKHTWIFLRLSEYFIED